MDLTRAHFLIAGLTLMLAGGQFRFIQAYRLSAEVAAKLAERKVAIGPVVTPPGWIGFALLAVGLVILIHGLFCKK